MGASDCRARRSENRKGTWAHWAVAIHGKVPLSSDMNGLDLDKFNKRIIICDTCGWFVRDFGRADVIKLEDLKEFWARENNGFYMKSDGFPKVYFGFRFGR